MPRARMIASLALAAVLVAHVAAVAATEGPPVPALRGPVVDQAHILSAPDRARISGLAAELEQKTGAEMAVLTMPSVAPLSPFDYGIRVVDTWKLGKRGKDNGLLLLVVMDERYIQILTGYGLEGILPDGKVGEIRDRYLVPAFRRGDFGSGVFEGMLAAALIIAHDAGVELTGQPSLPRRRQRRGVPVGLLIALLVFGPMLLPMAGRRRGRFLPFPYMGGGFGGGFGGGGFGGGLGGGGGFGGGGAGGRW